MVVGTERFRHWLSTLVLVGLGLNLHHDMPVLGLPIVRILLGIGVVVVILMLWDGQLGKHEG